MGSALPGAPGGNCTSTDRAESDEFRRRTDRTDGICAAWTTACFRILGEAQQWERHEP
jgi:hypothetical protein